MAVPTTRETFKTYCLRRLGEPVVDVNVDDDQVEDRIDDAIAFYRDYHYDGAERVLIQHQVTATDKTNKYISTNDNMFVRFSNSQIENLTASDKTFGFKDAKSDSWTIGYETNNKLGSFAFGVSKPNQLSSGTVSLVTPTGRSRSGDVFYAETEFAVSSENRLDKFFAYQHEKDNLALSFGVVEDRYNYGNIGAAKLDISYHF